MRHPLRPLSGSPSFVRPDEVPLLPIHAASADPPFLVDYRFDNVEYSLPGTHQPEVFLIHQKRMVVVEFLAFTKMLTFFESGTLRL